ncbi:MAG: hypothetical protein ACRELE_08710, partial [Gemmatimonadales bacterium]
GVGGMATVYLAGDIKPDRRVAVKGLRPAVGAALGAKRFLLEIKTTANLRILTSCRCTIRASPSSLIQSGARDLPRPAMPLVPSGARDLNRSSTMSCPTSKESPCATA